MLIFDAHLDLAMNALEWNRDLRWPIPDIRRSEKGMTDKNDRGNGTVSLPAMREGGIGLCVATQIARYVKPENPLPGWNSPEQAWAQTQGQLAWYRAMEFAGEMVQIKDSRSLKAHIDAWENDPVKTPIGYILSLEGADSILSFDQLEQSFEQGLRAIGLAHYGPGTYAYGTDSDGPLSQKGRQLLKEIERLDLILDATHLSDISFWETMNQYSGKVWASHSNCRALVPNERQFTDEQIRELVSRGAVVGAVLDAWMLVPGWTKRVTKPEELKPTLEHMADNIDHICQLAGNSLHAAIGTDLDGGFGTEQGPIDLDTISDIQKLSEILTERGYSETDITNVLSNNWIRFLLETWN